MRSMILAAVIASGSTFAFAGPSDHASRRFGDYSSHERPQARRDDARRNTPYALTGQRQQRRVLHFRDVPKGRGQTEQVAYWKWVSE